LRPLTKPTVCCIINSALVTLNTVGTTGINAWEDLASTLRARIGVQVKSLNQEKYSGCIITEKPLATARGSSQEVVNIWQKEKLSGSTIKRVMGS